MSVIEKIKIKLNSLEFLMYLLGTSLSLLPIGFAPSSIILGVFCVFSLRYYVLKRKELNLTWDITLILPVLLYLYFLSSYFWSVDVEQTLKGFERMIVLLLVPIAFSIIPKVSYKDYNIALKTFTYGNAVFGVFFICSAFYNFIETKSISVFTYHDLVSVLDLNAIYITLIFSISLFYLLSLKKKTKLEKALLICFIVLILLLSAKIILLVLLIGALIFLLKHQLYRLNKKKTIVGVFAIILALSISSITLYERFKVEQNTQFSEILNKKTFGKIYYWTGSSIRLFQLRILKEQIEEESIFLKGFGLFASKKNIVKRHKLYDTYRGFHKYNYHNQYAQILSETGIIGLLILLIMLGFSIVRAIKSKDYGFIMFGVTMITVFFTESVLWRQRGLFLFIILYCLYLKTSFIKQLKIK